VDRYRLLRQPDLRAAQHNTHVLQLHGFVGREVRDRGKAYLCERPAARDDPDRMISSHREQYRQAGDLVTGEAGRYPVNEDRGRYRRACHGRIRSALP
jgi:hypothetical protein